jgi:NAD(P)-dependent dehydrogenase (short-subunit alcohol dehydrogenase family)
VEGLAMSGLLEGKSALVTGAASGIGRASALAFAREGSRVMLADVDEAEGERAAEASVWLCSDRASFVTGHSMLVDGGAVAR